MFIGLGNPGTRYEYTRHNAGFVILENLRQVLECPKFTSSKKIFADVCKVKEAVFIKPQTFMNESGKAVKAALSYYDKQASKEAGGYQNLFVIHDDLDLPLGTYKIQYGTGPKGHNGLLSIYQHLKTENFWHIRVGIDSRDGDRTIAPQVYVLQKFTPQELEKFNQMEHNLVKELIQKV
jgi:PTH1 family peptidyl-tRNA hydrolase